MSEFVVSFDDGNFVMFKGEADYRYAVVGEKVDENGFVGWEMVRKSKDFKVAKKVMYEFARGNVGFEYQIKNVVKVG